MVVLSAEATAGAAGVITLNGSAVSASIATGSTITLPSWTPDPNDAILVAVAQRDESKALSVSGHGLTWTEVANVDNVQGQGGVSLWQAQGAAPATGSITVTISGNTLPVAVIAQRFAGVDTTTPVEAFSTHQGPVVDDRNMLHSVTTQSPDAWTVAVGWHRGATLTVPADETAILLNQVAGSSGATTRASMWYEGPVISPASTQLGAANDLSSANDWALIAVSLKPGSSGPVAPTANFSANPALTSGSSLAVSFTDTSTGSPTSWAWDFGDPASGADNTSTSQHPSHAYAAPGTYTVTLTATNDQGFDSEIKVDYIKVGVPTAGFSADQTSGTAPLTVSFTDTSIGDPTSWTWDFGDPASGAGNTSTSQNPSHTYDSAGQYTVSLTAANGQGSDTETLTSYITVTSGGGGGSVTVMAAGDIACDPTSSSFNGGNGTSSSCHMKYTADLLLALNPAAILALGDLQYENAKLTDFTSSYALSWGVSSLYDKTYPAAGNHEYQTSGASGYYDYWNLTGQDRGHRATNGYYSFDIGSWHIVVLNSNCSQAGGCGAGSPQETWLEADLEANKTTACTLAYWHHARFHGTKIGGATQALWQALYDYKADLILNGHYHHYERFARMNVSGAADPVNGIRQIIVGTGGVNMGGGTPGGNLEVVGRTYGVLELTLAPTSFTWEFVPEAGKTWTDSGTDQCH